MREGGSPALPMRTDVKLGFVLVVYFIAPVLKLSDLYVFATYNI